MLGTNAELKIVREQANGDVFVVLRSDNSEVQRTKIGEAVQAGSIVITLNVKEVNKAKVPELSIKRGAANAVIYGCKFLTHFLTYFQRDLVCNVS